MDMDFVDSNVGISLKSCKYRDRVFRLLFLFCRVFPFRYDIYAIRKTCP